ncbi:unnamed protein product [Brassicogethes aeneus]|uniref:Uncharacterized protein n=1 Tax=Brassicogethes aeneus TaxID=1431903 RepID=A0A9P0BCY9_BRAAE|nr:unnamed protein product [Brassicogethes aeneus]
MGNLSEAGATILFSYGFNGSSGQSPYKQKFDTPGFSDSSIFATTVIPLRLVFNDIILWNNRTPQSVRFCRPLKIQFAKETKELVLMEKEDIKDQINQLNILEIPLSTISYFSEEASESRNKLYKQDRQFHSRKTSRKNSLEDVFNRAMDTSDPYCSSINLNSRIKGHRTLNIPADVVSLFREINMHLSSQNGTSEQNKMEDEEKECYIENVCTDLLDHLVLENDDAI